MPHPFLEYIVFSGALDKTLIAVSLAVCPRNRHLFRYYSYT